MNICDNVKLKKSTEGKNVFGKSMVGNIDSGQSNVNDDLIIKVETSSYNSPTEAGITEFETEVSDSDSNCLSKNKYYGAYYKLLNDLGNLNIIKYICHRCKPQKSFIDQQCFEAHNLWHTGDKKPYKCSKCDYVCRCKSLLQKHKRNHHIDPEMFKCPFCEYKTDISGVRLGSLHRHMRSHPEFPFKCDECGESFIEFHLFEEHMYSHKFDNLLQSHFHCRNCGRKFKTKKEEIDHLTGTNGVTICFAVLATEMRKVKAKLQQ
ncbi:unnamed protein product [Meganyctiphanes norvegica]|uniref:C2H2-type domain-containing protein n=1 Tax=Meganyctiphanes norvegica TaxID=48144 RepID=A0AAV2QFB2_MEGNR